MTARPLHVFDVSVLGAERHVWLSVLSDQGSVFGIPRPLPEWSLGRSPADWLTGAVRQARNDAQAEALAVGRALHDLVFGVPEVVTLLQQARGAAGSAGAQLLVRVLAAPEEVSAWPWELIVDPQSPDRFLTLARDVHVVRSGRSRTYPVRQSPVEPPLNLLLVLSSPISSRDAEGETPFDLYEEKRSLLQELQPLVDRGLLHVEVEDRPTVERLRSRMGAQRRGFHLFHYLGHAQPSGLRLEERNGRGRLVRSQAFATLLQQMPDLRLAVFAGCETARAPGGGSTGAWPGALSVADYCVRDACPMVVGMQAVLPFGTERLFTRFFYQALTGGQPVVESLRLARLAIYDDEFAGGQLLNWSVPCLFVGGSLPGPVADPDVRAEPRPAPRRTGLRLGVRQGELRFISRLAELREAVDVLSGRSAVRLLHVTGLPGTGKTAFLDRALEELDPGVAQLFVSAGRLLEKDDPLHELCALVGEVLRMAGQRTRPQGRLTPAEWWERLLEDVTRVRLALVVDDAGELDTDPRGAVVVQALSELTLRRGETRLAVGADADVPGLTAPLRNSELRRVQLQALSWLEVWQWIRRNLPALTRYDEAELAAYYADLPHLEQWEQLAVAVASGRSIGLEDLPDVVHQVAARVGTGAQGRQPPPVFGEQPEPAAVGAGRRPLRLAVAGPYTQGRVLEFSRSITRFAAEHRVSGRVGPRDGGATASLAELLDLPSAFAGGAAPVGDVEAWVRVATEHEADVVVLDVGSAERAAGLGSAVARVAEDGGLVVAAGGNGQQPTWPAYEPSVLAVGALDEQGRPASYSPWSREHRKPDLYAPQRLRGTPVSALVAEPDWQGTSMSALYVAAAAVLVWATDRGLTGQDVRRVLVDTARSVGPHGARVRQVDVEAALARTRRQLIVDALQWDALEPGQLMAETGLRPEVAVPLLDALVAEHRVQRVVQDGVDRYEDPDSLYLSYARLRQRPSGWERTAQLQQLVARASALALRGRYSAGKVEALWASGHDGRRVVALGVVQARPDLGTLALVLSGVLRPRTAFEQYQALVAAHALADGLGPDDRARLAEAVRAALADGTVPAEGDRQERARALVARLGTDLLAPAR